MDIVSLFGHITSERIIDELTLASMAGELGIQDDSMLSVWRRYINQGKMVLAKIGNQEVALLPLNWNNPHEEFSCDCDYCHEAEDGYDEDCYYEWESRMADIPEAKSHATQHTACELCNCGITEGKGCLVLPFKRFGGSKKTQPFFWCMEYCWEPETVSDLLSCFPQQFQ